MVWKTNKKTGGSFQVIRGRPVNRRVLRNIRGVSSNRRKTSFSGSKKSSSKKTFSQREKELIANGYTSYDAGVRLENEGYSKSRSRALQVAHY